MKELSREDQLLVRALQFCFDIKVQPILAEFSESDWIELVDNAVQNGVSAYIWHHLKPFEGSLRIPERVRSKFSNSLLVSAGKGVMIQNQLAHLLALLQENKIWSLALKGVYLASMVYKDFSIRSMNDIDILIDRKDADRLEEILVENGNTPIISAKSPIISPHFVYSLGQRGLVLEVHICLMRIEYEDRFDFGKLQESSVPI